MMAIVGLLMIGFSVGLLVGWLARGLYVPRAKPVRRVPVLW